MSDLTNRDEWKTYTVEVNGVKYEKYDRFGIIEALIRQSNLKLLERLEGAQQKLYLTSDEELGEDKFELIDAIPLSVITTIKSEMEA